MAAREVAVSALATANAIDAGDDEDATAQSLGERLQGRWSLATALAFLAWFVFAPQCISTIAITRRETKGWKWPLFMVGYLFVIAYDAAEIGRAHVELQSLMRISYAVFSLKNKN